MRPSELDPERWRRIDRLLEAALETPPAEREAFLSEACAGDEPLRAELEALLSSSDQADATFEQPLDVSAEALAASSAALPPDRCVGPFILQRELGRGGMGVVYLAEDSRLGRQVALKALPPYLGAGPEAKRRLEAEARAVSVLDHPNIATLYEIGETDEGQLYLAFAFYEGETLEARIARGQVPVEEALDIATGIAAGLAAAHEVGIIHRDVKPSNVLLTTGGVKLLDFGVAKVIGVDVTQEGVRPGTIAYMSPEQTGGDGIDHRTDLWSLGVTTYEMLTGRRPFRGDDPLSLRDAIVRKYPPSVGSLRDDIPKAVEWVVDRLLRKDPGDRYPDMSALLADLRALAAGSALAVAAPKTTGRTTGLRPRRRLVTTVLLSLVVGAGAIAAAVWLGGGFSGEAVSTDIRRLAVLPLRNLTGDAQQLYLVDGIHDALIAELGRIEGLDIISRTSVMRYRASEMTIPEIAAELGVDAVVEGSVFRGGDSIAITTQLIVASPERQVWAARYGRSEEDVFAITGEVARSIASAVDIEVTPAEDSGLRSVVGVDPSAYDAYLRGWVHWARRNRDGFDLARSYFQRAIEIDSTFAPAYAGLAETHSGAADWGLADPAVSFPLARDLAATALLLDNALPEAYAAMAAIEFNYSWNWAAAEALASRALELHPTSVRALRILGGALSRMGRREEARAVYERANELDTQVPGMGTAVQSYVNRAFDQAIVHARTAQEFDEGLWQAPWIICMSLAGQGLHDRAIEDCESVIARFGRDNPVLLASLGYVYAVGGQRAGALRVIEELRELAGEVYVAPGLTAMVYGALGEHERAFEWLDRAFETRDSFLMKLRLPFFDPLRADPRFDDLQRNIGVAPRPVTD